MATWGLEIPDEEDDYWEKEEGGDEGEEEAPTKKKKKLGGGDKKGEKRGRTKGGGSGSGGSGSAGGSGAPKPKATASKGKGDSNRSNPPRYRDLLAQVAQNTRDLAHVMACVFYTVLIPKTSSYVWKALQVGQSYYEKTKNRKGHSMGSPHLHIFNCWVVVTRDNMGSHLTADEAEAITKFSKDYKEMDDAAQVVKLARCSKTYDPEMYRLQFNTYPVIQKLVDTFLRFMKWDGGVVKWGAAPRGPRERRIDAYLRGQKAEEEEAAEADGEE